MYNREVPGEIRLKSLGEEGLQKIGALEPLNLKILVRGFEANPDAVKIEITSEYDLFLHFTYLCDRTEFRILAETQKLLVDMDHLTSVLMKLANDSIREPNRRVNLCAIQYECNAPSV